MKENKEQTPKQKRTPRKYESIFSGALTLSLEDKVSLLKVIQQAIHDEVARVTEIAKQATDIAKGI